MGRLRRRSLHGRLDVSQRFQVVERTGGRADFGFFQILKRGFGSRRN